MTQEELNRFNEGRKLRYDIDILRKASLITANSRFVNGMSDDEKRSIVWDAIGLIADQLPNIFFNEADRLERKFDKL